MTKYQLPLEKVERAYHYTWGVLPDEPWKRLSEESKKDILKFANRILYLAQGEPVDEYSIQEDDIVRGVLTDSLGAICYYEGVVTHSKGVFWLGGINLNTFSELFLLHRPKDELPTKAPAIVHATKVRDVEGSWYLFLTSNNGFWASEDGIKGYTKHLPRDITAWEHADPVVRKSEEHA